MKKKIKKTKKRTKKIKHEPVSHVSYPHWMDGTEVLDPNMHLPEQHQRAVARAETLQQYVYGPLSFEENANNIIADMTNAMEKFKMLFQAFSYHVRQLNRGQP